MILCHRGIQNYYPENTLGSINEALSSEKYDGVELDINLTKDNKWIIYHDSNLLRLNSINEDVSNINFSDINKIEWKGNHFLVNLLSELSSIKTNKILNIEIKPKYSNSKNYQQLLNILSNFHFKYFLSSFDYNWLDWVNKNLNTEFACISNKKIPSKGNFWILDYKLINNIDLFDIIEKNIKLGSYGKYINYIDYETSPLKLQIIDERNIKNIYIDGLFENITIEDIEFFEQARLFGDRLIVGLYDENCELSLDSRKKILENIKLIDEVIVVKLNELSKSILQQKEVDIIISKKEKMNHYKHAKDMGIFKLV